MKKENLHVTSQAQIEVMKQMKDAQITRTITSIHLEQIRNPLFKVTNSMGFLFADSVFNKMVARIYFRGKSIFQNFVPIYFRDGSLLSVEP